MKSNIKCYVCGKNGKAFKYKHFFEKVILNSETLEKEKVEIESYIWKAKGFKNVGLKEAEVKLDKCLWICKKCLARKCKICGVILSNDWMCSCGNYHGAFYKAHPDYCKECWNKFKKR